MPTSAWHFRPGRDSDGPALIDLIWSCWRQYPGIQMDVDGEMPQLHALATAYTEREGKLWVAEIDNEIKGMIAVHPLEATTWEICQVYADPAQHGSGLGHALLNTAEHHVIIAGATRLALWSDTRFDRAHHFYEKRSYVRHGPIRPLQDISNSLEYAYAKPVNGIQQLDIAAATSAETKLSEILIACVNEGAAVTFLPPLPEPKAKAFWHQIASDVGIGKKILLSGWQNGELIATGMLNLDTPENQPHRAEVQKLLVHPKARRHGLGRQIMQALEQSARTAGRSLLTLDTRTGGAAEALCRAQGWQESGRIPGYAIAADGTPDDAVFFWKRI